MTDGVAVPGIRHRSWTPIGVGLRVIGTLCFLAPFWWIVELIRHASYRFNDGLIATIGLSAVFVLLFIIGVLALSSWGGYFSKTVLESDCPVCGTRAKRDYNERATSCGTCIAYLRADGTRVREESIDAQDGSYMVEDKRLRPALKPLGRDGVAVAMPAICAVCGSPDATQQRTISRIFETELPGASIAGAVAKEVAYSAMSREARAKTGLWGPLGSGPYQGVKGPAKDADLDPALAEVKFPVCETHAAGGPSEPIRCMTGNLWFTSYRYYKAFLAENGIDGPVTARAEVA
jgi:hypothetical protein